MNKDKWHSNWLVDILLRLGFLTLLAWVGVRVAMYMWGLGEVGEPLPPMLCGEVEAPEALPQGE